MSAVPDEAATGTAAEIDATDELIHHHDGGAVLTAPPRTYVNAAANETLEDYSLRYARTTFRR